ADLARNTALPGLKPARVVADNVAFVRVPRRGVEIDKRRLKRADDVAPHVKKAGAARSAQIFSAGRRQYVAADLSDVDRELADRLAGIQKIEHVVTLGDSTDPGGRIDEAALGRHMGDRNQPGA